MFSIVFLQSDTPNHALQRTRRERRGCNRCVLCAGSLSLGRWRHEHRATNWASGGIADVHTHLFVHALRPQHWPCM